MKRFLKNGLAYTLSVVMILSLMVLPAMASVAVGGGSGEAWRSFVTMTQEDEFEGEAYNSGITWRNPGGSGTAGTNVLTPNVADPTGGNEKMLKFEFPYVEAEKATKRSRYIDNNNDKPSDAATTGTFSGVTINEQSFYFSSKESLLADDSYVIVLANFFTGNGQTALVMRRSGFFGNTTATANGYGGGMALPMDQWFKILTVADYDNGKWHVKLVTNDGKVTNLRTVSQTATKNMQIMRFTYVDTVATEGTSSWFGMGYYRQYNLKAPEITGITATGGKAAVGNEIGVACNIPNVKYQWCKDLTETGYSSTLITPENISGATSATYTPTTADEGNYLFVKISCDMADIYPGWPTNAVETLYPAKGTSDWAIDPNPFVMDFGTEEDGTVYYRTGGNFVNAAKTLLTNVAGNVTAVTAKNVGGTVKDDALKISVTGAAANNSFWMWENNAFGDKDSDVVQIEQKYFIPSNGAFMEGSAEYLRHDNRFGYGQRNGADASTVAKAELVPYALYNGHITNSGRDTNYAPIPFDEWFAIRVVYFFKNDDADKVYRDIVLVREDGTAQSLISGEVISNATVMEAMANGGYRRGRLQLIGATADKTYDFYLGDLTVKTTKDYAETPWLYTGEAEEGTTVLAATIVADYTDNEPANYKLIVAHYSGNQLVGVQVSTEEAVAGKANKLTSVLTKQVIAEGDVLKAFLVNGDNIMPLAKNATIVVE